MGGGEDRRGWVGRMEEVRYGGIDTRSRRNRHGMGMS